MCLEIFRRAMVTSVDDLKSSIFWRAAAAELIGTMLLVFAGCSSGIGWEHKFEPTTVQISLCAGLSVATIVWIIAHLSGGHINPAVTMSMLVTRKISLVRAVMFIIAQCCGAIAGAGILKGLTPVEARGSLGATTIHPSLEPIQGFGIELMITFVLVLTAFATCDSKRTDLHGSGPLAIGLSVTMCCLFAAKYTGSSMNPARSLGPAVIMNIWEDHWIYWCGPLLGAIIAGVLYDTVFDSNASMSKARAFLTSTYDPENYLEINKNSILMANKMECMIEKEKPFDVNVSDR